jgi:hypothetical protein
VLAVVSSAGGEVLAELGERWPWHIVSSAGGGEVGRASGKSPPPLLMALSQPGLIYAKAGAQHTRGSPQAPPPTRACEPLVGMARHTPGIDKYDVKCVCVRVRASSLLRVLVGGGPLLVVTAAARRDERMSRRHGGAAGEAWGCGLVSSGTRLCTTRGRDPHQDGIN